MMKNLPACRRRSLLLAALWAGVANASPDARALLLASDAIRNPGIPFGVTVTLTEFQSGSQVDTSTLQSWARPMEQGGQYASLLRFVKPARDAGKLMLKAGNDLWFYDPVSKASVRLSPQQRLLGQASNGDVATVDFAKDYSARILAEEDVTDGDKRTRHAYKLGLDASTPEATYTAIELWVDAENSRPIRARFYADSGRLLKTAYYRRYQRELGRERPTEMVIIDGLDPKSVTLMRFSDYAARDVPAAWMHKDHLPRFQPE